MGRPRSDLRASLVSATPPRSPDSLPEQRLPEAVLKRSRAHPLKCRLLAHRISAHRRPILLAHADITGGDDPVPRNISTPGASPCRGDRRNRTGSYSGINQFAAVTTPSAATTTIRGSPRGRHELRGESRRRRDRLVGDGLRDMLGQQNWSHARAERWHLDVVRVGLDVDDCPVTARPCG
jgi:hypothetical protein